jgi:uncharacterized Fe-S center protein
MDIDQNFIIDDIGILLSDDPVEIDQATLDLTKDKKGKNFSEISRLNLDANIQLKHAEEISMGNRKYKLVKL